MNNSTWNMIIERDIETVENLIEEHGENTTLAEVLNELCESLIEE